MQAEVDPTQDTEFHDALRAHGIIPPKPPSRSPSPELPTDQERRATELDKATVEDIDRALEQDGGRGGEDGDEEEKLLLRIRQQRLDALAKERKRGRFGRVYPISRPDYTREVTEASKVDPDRIGKDDDDPDDDDDVAETGAGTVGGSAAKQSRGKGTGVVCFLYKDSIEECRLLSGYLDRLASKYPATKFVSIVGDQCIPNYPDKNLPTLLVYRNGELHRQIIGLRPEIGLDGMKTKCEDIELLLTAVGVVDRSTVPGSATHQDNGEGDMDRREKVERRKEERQEADDQDEGFGGSNRKYDKPSVRSQEEEDDDLDWDL